MAFDDTNLLIGGVYGSKGNVITKTMEELDFRVEAEAALKEVAYTIREGGLSIALESKTTCAYINLTTVEGKKFTIRLSRRGFEVSLLSYCSQKRLKSIVY